MDTYLKVKAVCIGTVLAVLLLVQTPSFAEIIDVQIKGLDDGIKTTKQQDYKEACLFAKREAIERSGVEIESMTKVQDLIVHEDYIESKAKAVLLPGYNIIDIGYTEDGVYTVMLIGKIYTKIDSNPSEEKDDSTKSEKDQKTSSSKTPGEKTADQSEADVASEGDSNEPRPSSPYKDIALLTLRTVPAGAFVIIDGQPMGKSPILKREIKPGKHRLRIELAGYQVYAREIILFPGNKPHNNLYVELIHYRTSPQPEYPKTQRPKSFPRKNW